MLLVNKCANKIFKSKKSEKNQWANKEMKRCHLKKWLKKYQLAPFWQLKLPASKTKNTNTQKARSVYKYFIAKKPMNDRTFCPL